MRHHIEKTNDFVKNNGIERLISIAETTIEAQYENLLKMLAEKIGDSEDFFGVIFVAGPSSSGKTTFSNVLAEKISGLKIHTNVLSLDDFYFDTDIILKREKKLGVVPKTAEAGDYETIEAFDVTFFRSLVKSFSAGEAVRLPRFDFTLGKRLLSDRIIKRTGRDFLIIEGIQAMNPKLTRGLRADFVYRIYICPYNEYAEGEHLLTQQMIRLMRRSNRDFHKRGSDLKRTLDMWESVLAGEEKYIKPMLKYADYYFNSSYSYEPLYLSGELLKMAESLEDNDKKMLARYLVIDAVRLYINYK